MEQDSCSETEDESESEDKEEYTPFPHGTVAPKVVPADAVAELVRRVYGSEGDDPIVIHEDEVEAVGVIMSQLSLKQGLKTWGKERRTAR